MQIEDVDKIKADLPPYEDLLNLANNGIMGYIEIPAINIDLPIYHGTTCLLYTSPGREFKDLDVDVHENGKTYEVTLTNALKYAPLKIVKTSEAVSYTHLDVYKRQTS